MSTQADGSDDVHPSTPHSDASSSGSLQVEMTLDGFRFSVLPEPSYFGFLVGLPLTFLLYILGFLVLPRLLIDWLWLPLMVLLPFAWIVPMALIDRWRDERMRAQFVVDAAGLVHESTRYSWAQMGRPQVDQSGLLLADGTRFDFRLDERESARLAGLLDHTLPVETDTQVPSALKRLRQREGV